MVCVKSVYIYKKIYISAPTSCHQTATGETLLKGEGVMVSVSRGLGAFAGIWVAFAGGSSTRGTHPVAQFFILGFFAQNVTFGRTDFFQHSPHPRAPPEIFSHLKTQRFATLLILRELRKIFKLCYARVKGVTLEFLCISKCLVGLSGCA